MKHIMRKVLSWLLVMAMMLTMTPVVFAADGAQFKNGPYLLAPKTDSMVVAWESTEQTDATIAYGTQENALGEPISVSPDADAPEFQGAKMQLYYYKLENLEPGTRYYYEVKLAGGESCKASFKTLSDDPDNVNLISLSDSHIFATRAELDASVKSYDPDVILHCGDLVEGTGAQAEQFSFWFHGDAESDFIHAYPVVYASGNHDQGGTYFDAYVYKMQDAEYGATVEGDSSFNYGGIHLITMNSSPWGLFQMNSEATGKAADAATLQTIDDAMTWLKADLETDDAKNAEFRIIMMHHPVSDAYTKRYIPAVIEPGNVNLLLSGHTHSYARAVSENPAVGAGTIYLTHQDARTYNKKGDFFHITGTPGEGVLTVENYGAVGATSDSKLANTTLVGSKTQLLSFSDVSITPDEVLCNGEVTVSATVTNNGKGLAAAAIPVSDNGTTRYLYWFDGAVKTLEPGESASLTGTLKMDSLGTHTLQVADKTVAVEVQFRDATFSYDNLRVKLGTGETSDIESNILNIKADVTNMGNAAGMASAAFQIDGASIASKSYQLAAGETKTAEFSYTFDKAGTYQVTIGDAAAQTVYIEGGIQGMPIVMDKSGNENNGYIHGEPELGTDDQGNPTLVLDGYRDYIEVPDNGGYTATDGISGMVWANLPSAGTTKGGVSELTEQYEDLDGKGAVPDHNPLMMKGIGLGWGTPYLFRIAVRETGKVTYGVCLLDDNGEFSWNDGSQDEAGIQKDAWVQYTSTFDFTNGGDGYENGYNSAHVDKPAFTAPLKNWEGEPLYIGLGFKNTLLTNRNRGMYHTMLPGAVSQVRFYNAKVSAEENDAVRANPTTAGASAQNLKIWLDFSPETIETKGTHTTEWVAATAAPTALQYHVALQGAATATAVVQTSDDGSAVKEEKTIDLQNGENTVDLTGMQTAKYVRMQTAFVSDLNETASSVPVLYEYVLDAGVTKRWNTLADWNKGVFSGAAAHQSGDVYRDHAQDFDDYSGTASQPDAVGFTDVVNHWAKTAIDYVTSENLFTGISASQFAPEKAMTRGMFVTVLGRMANAQGSGEQAAAVFADVDADAYYAPYVDWAQKNGVINGVSANQFAPSAVLSREQMVTVLRRYIDSNALELPETTSRTVFADDTDISAYARDAVYDMQQSGILLGEPDNRFDPQGVAVRADVAALIARFAQTFEAA